MDSNFLTSKLMGRWVVQSTNCSSRACFNHTKILINQVSWTYMKTSSYYLKFIMLHLKQQNEVSKIDLCCMESIKNHSNHEKHYVSLIYEGPQLKFLIKFSHDFNFLNKFVVHNCSENQLTIVSYNEDIKIIEKIYFLSCNLKVIKSTILKNNSCVGTSFSSEIRIA